MCIPASSPNKDLAWRFCEFAFQAQNLVILTSLMPATKAANQLVNTDAIYTPFKEVLASNARHPIPLSPVLPQQAQIILDQSQSALIGRTSADKAAQAAAQQIDTTLATIQSM